MWNARFRRFMLATLIVAVLSLLAAQSAKAQPHVLRFADGLDLTGLNPLRPEAAPNYELNFLTMAYLTRYGKSGIVPELLALLPTERNGGISADGKTIRLTLRRGVKWSDGAVLTSADIAFTVATVNDPKTNSQYHAGFDKIARVDTPNEVTAILHLTERYGRALDVFFSSHSAPLLPRHLLLGRDFNTAPFNALPVGAGPFRFTKWERGDRVELERNPNYALGRPKLKRIIYKMIPTDPGTVTAIRTGEIDSALALTYSEVKPIEADPAIHILTMRGVRPARLTLNVTRPALSDPEVRRALRLGLNRSGILQRSYLGSGVLAESPVAGSDPGVAHIPLVPYDPAGAARLLDRAGWKVGADGVRVKNGRRLELEVVAGAGALFVDQIIELVRADWGALGAAVTTKRYQLSLMFAPAEDGGIVFGGKFDAALFSNGEQTAAEAAEEPLCRNVPPKGTNFSRLCVPPYDAFVAKAGATYDPAVSGPMYREAQARIADLTPTIVLALRNELFLARDNVVGAAVYPLAFFFDPLALDVVK